MISELRQSLSAAVPVMTIDFGQRISDLLGDLMSTPKPIEIKIFGTDYSILQKVALQAEDIMKIVPGVVDIDNGMIPAGSSLVSHLTSNDSHSSESHLPIFRNNCPPT